MAQSAGSEIEIFCSDC